MDQQPRARLRIDDLAGVVAARLGAEAATSRAHRRGQLAADSVRARLAHERARAAATAAIDALEATLTPEQYDRCREALERHGELWDACWEMHVAELVRHTPGIASVLRRILDEHIILQRLADVGRCCGRGVPPARTGTRSGRGGPSVQP